MKQIGGTHYQKHPIQPIDVMKEYMTDEQMEGYLIGNVVKYVLRYRDKHPTIEMQTEDLKKARWYLDMLIKVREVRECGA